MRSVPSLLVSMAAVAIAFGAARPARAQSFEDALAQAYLYNPQIAAERQRLRETDEGVPRALSGWRPRISIDGSAGVSAIEDSLDRRHDPERRVPQYF